MHPPSPAGASPGCGWPWGAQTRSTGCCPPTPTPASSTGHSTEQDDVLPLGLDSASLEWHQMQSVPCHKWSYYPWMDLGLFDFYFWNNFKITQKHKEEDLTAGRAGAHSTHRISFLLGVCWHYFASHFTSFMQESPMRVQPLLVTECSCRPWQ